VPIGLCFQVKGILVSRISGFSSPFLLGFEEIERVLDHVTKTTSDGYPPYNIERIRPEDRAENSFDIIRITLAVAGFSDDELEITLEENQLQIKGCQIDDNNREYLHRGIAARQFQRSFVLAEGLQIKNAELKSGLLSVNLVQPEVEKLVRKIKITNLENS
jgi:HSP20 family molecular chaperone IbpA